MEQAAKLETGNGTASKRPTSNTAHFHEIQKEKSLKRHERHSTSDSDQSESITFAGRRIQRPEE